MLQGNFFTFISFWKSLPTKSYRADDVEGSAACGLAAAIAVTRSTLLLPW